MARLLTGIHHSVPLGTLVLAALVSLGIVLTAGLWLTWGPDLSVKEVKETILSWEAWGILASIGLMVLHSFVPFPAEVIACVNGMAYGPILGTGITWIGAMLGAFVSFGLARSLGRPFVEVMVARRNWCVLDAWEARKGWQVVLISRFTPIIAFNLVNYAAGLTRISWWTFAWTTGIGILPLTVLMVVMGDNFDMLPWYVWLLLLGGGIILLLVCRWASSAFPDNK